jgi:hypothetical protein
MLDQKIPTWANVLPAHFACSQEPRRSARRSRSISATTILIRHEYGLKHEYSNHIADECVNIAADTIEALTVIQASVFGASERYTSTSFVAAALLALIAVLLAEETGTPRFVAGGKAFVKGVEVLDKLCGGLSTRAAISRPIFSACRGESCTREPEFASLVELL